jgi:hypothetical protein
MSARSCKSIVAGEECPDGRLLFQFRIASVKYDTKKALYSITA